VSRELKDLPRRRRDAEQAISVGTARASRVSGFRILAVTLLCVVASARAMAQSNDSLHNQSVIKGRVTDEQGKALSNATIRLASGDSTRSDNEGEFRIESQAGNQLLQIRMLGFGAVDRKIELSAGDSLSLQIALSRVQTQLPPVLVRDVYDRVADLTGFRSRSKVGAGFYITADDIRKRRPLCLLDAIDGTAGFFVTKGGGGCDGQIHSHRKRYSVMVKTEPECVKVFVDDAEDSGWQLLPPMDIVGIELYQMSTAPVRYPGGDCAIVVVWTAWYRGAHH
jgi:Carboxypeptidase regulatory-like domain